MHGADVDIGLPRGEGGYVVDALIDAVEDLAEVDLWAGARIFVERNVVRDPCVLVHEPNGEWPTSCHRD